MNDSGLLLIDKPAGWTSTQVVRCVKGAFSGAKSGHAGTLDPAAMGLLIVGVGEGTKVLHYLLGQSKRYTACVCLGTKTATGDAEGEVIETCKYASPEAASLRALFERFTGELQQVPPMYSALKHAGKRLYTLARKQQTVERKPRRVTIYSLALKNCTADGFCFEVHCSKGTYVRTLAEDLGSALGTVAHLASLRRTASGAFSVRDAVDAQVLKTCDVGARLLPVDAGLAHLPAARLNAGQADQMRCGMEVALAQLPAAALFRVYDASGVLLAVAAGNDGRLRPKRVFRGGGGLMQSISG